MKWYYKVMGDHTHVRVFMNGGKCGDLCFRNQEFEQLRESLPHQVQFMEEGLGRLENINKIAEQPKGQTNE